MTTEPKQMTLPQLILTKKGERTYAKIAEDCGGTPTKRRLNSIVLRPMNAFPDIATIRGLAIGLRVSVTDVLLASARSLGLNVSEGNPGALVIEGGGYLPVSAQEALQALAGELMKMQEMPNVPTINALGGHHDPGFTEYQCQLRQDFAHGARLRRVPAVEIEAALQAPGWGMVEPGDDDLMVAGAILGWVTGDHARQLKAALRDVLVEGATLVQDHVELAADKGDSTISAEAEEHHT